MKLLLPILLAALLACLQACKPEVRTDGERVIADRQLTRQEFREIFAPVHLLGPGQCYYHGVQGGLIYLSVVDRREDEAATAGGDPLPLVRRYTVATSVAHFAPAMAFTTWPARRSLRITGLLPSGRSDEAVPPGTARYRLAD